MKAGPSPVPEPSVASGVSLRRLDLRRTAAQAVVYLFVLATVLFFLLPVFWMASTSFKEPKQVFSTPPTWIPLPPVADYYAENLGNAQMRGYFKNTMIITGFNILAAVLVNPLVAFSFARRRWPGRRLFFTVLLITIMLPVQVTLIPIYIIFRDFGWLNTYLPLIIPLFFGNPVYIFLIRQFILSMPGEMLDAGRIDGCSNYRLYFNLTLPLLGAPIATVAIFQFMFSWNDFLYPLVFINSDAMKTLALGLMDLMTQSQFTGVFDWGLSMSATALALVPCFIVYLIAQRYFIQGVNITQVYTGR